MTEAQKQTLITALFMKHAPAIARIAPPPGYGKSPVREGFENALREAIDFVLALKEPA
jgi:hypothetical protein